MSAAAMAFWAAGSKGVGPGVKSRVLRNITKPLLVDCRQKAPTYHYRTGRTSTLAQVGAVDVSGVTGWGDAPAVGTSPIPKHSKAPLFHRKADPSLRS